MSYERMPGWHTPALRRAGAVAVMGVLAGLLLSFFVRWELALIGGWDVTALGYLGAVWPVVLRADRAKTRELADREDDTRASEAALLIGASVTSLLGVGLALILAGRAEDLERVVLIAVGVATVVLSWFVVNTVYTLKYAQLDGEQDDDAVDFESAGKDQPTYRDFAYLAFTIGMTYQVSDTTLRSAAMRRTVLGRALLSYLFGVVIVAGVINLIAGLLR